MLLYETQGKSSLTLVIKDSLSCLPHLHSRIEAGIITDGSTLITVHGKNYTVNAGEAFFVPPNTVHSYTDAGGIRALLLICPPEDIAHLFGEGASYSVSSHIARPQDPKMIESSFLRAQELSGKSSDTALQGARAYAAAIIAELLLLCEASDGEKGKDLSAAQKILDFCDKSYKQNLNLDILSRELGYSKYYISRVFSGDIKSSFTDYLRGLRIHAAKRLLRSTNMSVTDIAYEVGYTCVRTFNRHFSQVTGLSPTEYAKARRQPAKQ